MNKNRKCINFINWMMNKCTKPLTTFEEISKSGMCWAFCVDDKSQDYLINYYLELLTDLCIWEWDREYEEVVYS